MQYLPYGKQNISEDDIAAVVEILRSDWLTQGPMVEKFEQALCQYCGSQFSRVVGNATAALHLAYLALGVTAGDTVWTSPNTFLSTANTALMCGAKIDFVDICPKTYNMSVVALEDKLITAKKNNQLPKVIVPVHFAGQSCDMKRIYELSREYGFRIVEDAAHAIGGKYLDKPIGSCQYSDITIFSFHPVKVITTGEGGALLTNDSSLSEKIALLRTHGMTRDKNLMDKESEGPWYYQMLGLGFNYRLTDIQCALGLSQIQRLDQFVSKRHKIKNSYDNLLASITEIRLPYQGQDSYSALHLYPIQVSAKIRKKVFEYLRTNDIGVNVHYIPVHTQPYYRDKFGFSWGDFPNAENYYKQAISLPLFPGLNENDQYRVVQALQEALN